MIIDLLLWIGRAVDHLLGHARSGRSSLEAWRTPLQLPDGDGPWSFHPPTVEDVDLAKVSIDSEGWLTEGQARELVEHDILRLSGDDLS